MIAKDFLSGFLEVTFGEVVVVIIFSNSPLSI